MSEKLSGDELLWRRYNLLADLYKFYLEMIVNASLLIFGITGGIVAYTFSNAGIPVIKWSLGLPLLFCITFAFLSLRGVKQARELQQEVSEIREKLQLGLAVHADILVYALFATGIMFVLVSIALIVIFSLAYSGGLNN